MPRYTAQYDEWGDYLGHEVDETPDALGPRNAKGERLTYPYGRLVFDEAPVQFERYVSGGTVLDIMYGDDGLAVYRITLKDGNVIEPGTTSQGAAVSSFLAFANCINHSR